MKNITQIQLNLKEELNQLLKELPFTLGQVYQEAGITYMTMRKFLNNSGALTPTSLQKISSFIKKYKVANGTQQNS